MRLKLIFFPIVLIVSVTLIINNIFPQIRQIREIRKEKSTRKIELEAVSKKQIAINDLSKKITEDVETTNAAKGYLADKKVEEKIISSINYLAGDANLALTGITISGDTKAVEAVQSIDPATGEAVAKKVDAIQKIPVKISVSGDYGKIKIFLSNLEHMPIFNNIKTLKISKQKVEKKEGEEASAGNMLLADINVDFGYMKSVEIDGTIATNFKPELDSETANVLKTYVSQKSQFVENSNEQKGKPNPFFAN